MNWHNKTNILASAILSSLALSGCQQAAKVESTSVASELAPMPQIVHSVGDKWHYVSEDGTTDVWTVNAVDGATYSMSNNAGCSLILDDRGFAPGLAWAECPPHANGTQKLTANGNIWPLTVGNSMSYELTGSNEDGDNWSTTRKCEVMEQVRVTVQAGEFDTYHVRCRDSWRTRDWYVSPSVGRSVLHINKHRKRQTVTRQEMTKFEPAST